MDISEVFPFVFTYLTYCAYLLNFKKCLVLSSYFLVIILIKKNSFRISFKNFC